MITRDDRSAERARQDYVKAIYQMGRDVPVTGAALARYLGVSRAAVSKSRRLLVKEGLVTAAASRTDEIRLTRRGEDMALRMIRRHRLIETFLHRSLNVPLDAVHAQAEAIEHVISDDVAARLARFLGNPSADPHGHPIARIKQPSRHGPDTSLAAAPKGSRIRIESIPDRDPSLVRHLALERVLPGLTARVVERGGRYVTLRSPKGTHVVTKQAAASIRVTQRERA